MTPLQSRCTIVAKWKLMANKMLISFYNILMYNIVSEHTLRLLIFSRVPVIISFSHCVSTLINGTKSLLKLSHLLILKVNKNEPKLIVTYRVISVVVERKGKMNRKHRLGKCISLFK